MNQLTDVSVILTPELYERLLGESNSLDIPLEWLVASLVVDTLESGPGRWSRR
jgi:hypothetical protein